LELFFLNNRKATDGLFLEVFRDVAKKYPSIQSYDFIIDNCCMQLVMKPSQFDVMVTTNLYGNIITNVAGGLIGGPGIVGGANMGENIALFEPVSCI
jgi:isocitrate dehydrogenase (NAD+)